MSGRTRKRKHLSAAKSRKMKREIKMTYLGQLLVEDGRADGRAEERKNTERERLRAEKAEAELQKLKKQLGLV